MPTLQRSPEAPHWLVVDLGVTVIAGVALLGWDASGLDLPLVRLFGSPSGFGWKDSFLLAGLVHNGGRALGWLVCAALLLNCWRPLRWMNRLSLRERTWWLLTTLACALLFPAIKHFSLTSCPWDLVEFGGRAAYVSHWQMGLSDGGSGHCFPSGHASSAFAFLAGYFVLRPHHRSAAQLWLLAVCALGVLYGAAQMMRGAHYASHTLWTAWLSWTLTATSYHMSRRWLGTASKQLAL
jgi:membrane-associated PAP2 superfamily phosphatase